MSKSTLILLRHGQSLWNEQNLFTGWFDVDLTPKGEDEARAAGQMLADENLLPDVVRTSMQRRAIRTANLALETLDRIWIPQHRHWRLNERHYGDLQGRNKSETAALYGDDQVLIWRRSYDIRPPALELNDERHPRNDVRYAALAPDLLPATECLADVVARMLPYWYDAIVGDLRLGRTVMVAAHGNSLRALVKHLDNISDKEITQLNIPTGLPLVYELDDQLKPLSSRYLGDQEAAKAAAEAVANQAKG